MMQRLASAITLCSLAAASAHAAITCSIAVTSVSVVYDPASRMQNVTTGSYTISSTLRGTDPNHLRMAARRQRRHECGRRLDRCAARTACPSDRYNYDTYRSSAVMWGDTAATCFSAT
jgi:hypothetical protein